MLLNVSLFVLFFLSQPLTSLYLEKPRNTNYELCNAEHSYLQSEDGSIIIEYILKKKQILTNHVQNESFMGLIYNNP